MPPRPRLKTMPRRGRRWGSAAGLLPAVGLLVYVTIGVMRLATGGGHPSTAGGIPGAGAGCVAWRNTLACSPYGERFPSADRGCEEPIDKDAGYCECSGGWTTHRMSCGQRRPVTCTQACHLLTLDQKDAVQFPAPLDCKEQGPYMAERYITRDDPAWAAAAADLQSQAATARVAAVAGVRRLAAAPSAAKPDAQSQSVQGQHTADMQRQQGQNCKQQQQQQQPHHQQWQRADVLVAAQQSGQPSAQQSTPHQDSGSQQQRRLAASPAQEGMAAGSGKQLGLSEADRRAAALWGRVEQALLAAGPHAVQPPGVRTHETDFVRLGKRMDRSSVQRAQQQWHAFMAEAPLFPEGDMGGRGIVILSGTLPYMVPAWVNIHMLRLTGCQLPVEMWFPEAEAPTAGLAVTLARLGATVRLLPKAAGRAGGFTLKAATVLLSGFEEVLFLDADNMAVRDPEPLFGAAGYNATGALLWPDYWEASAAPDLAAVLGLSAAAVPGGTFESGQMILHKRRVWRGLLLATFMNAQSALYYELLSNFMGKGDKETFPYALTTANLSYSTVATPVGSVGVQKMHCNRKQTHCWHEFAGNTMTQHDEQGRVMFLHTNFVPKMGLQLPHSMEAYTRRWQVVEPGNLAFADVMTEVGRDLERDAFEALAHFRCAPWLPELLAAQGTKPPPPLQGFHPLHNGMDFRRPYRWGMQGPYLRFTKVTLNDWIKHHRNKWLRPWLKRHGLGSRG